MKAKQYKLGSNFVLVGHSERRMLYNETDELVSKKIKRAIEENLNVILCIGENEDEKNKNITKKKLEQQIFYSINERCNPCHTYRSTHSYKNIFFKTSYI